MLKEISYTKHILGTDFEIIKKTKHMEPDKLKTYNQRVIAALITILLIIATILLIKLVIEEIKTLLPSHDTQTSMLLSDDKVLKLKSDSLRKQIISYQSPILVDTINLVYLIPVDVKTLNNSENNDKDVSYSKKERVIAEMSTENDIYQLFSNLIVYDYRNNSTKKICSDRLVGSNLKIKYFNDEIILVFIGMEKDSNKDGLVNYLDLGSLYIYSLKEKKLQKFFMNNSSVSSFNFVEKEKDILVNWEYDRNGDNEFDQETEPTFITRYDHAKKTITPIVDSKLEKEIQRIIDKK